MKAPLAPLRKSQWSFPCVLVSKSDGTFRFYNDFWQINGIFKTDTKPIPRVDNCSDEIGHAKHMSKFDLLKGYV